MSTFFLTTNAIECMNSLAALSDFQKTFQKNLDALTVEEVWDTNSLSLSKYIYIESTFVISTSCISTLRTCQRICKVPNSVPIHSIYIYSVKVDICKSKFGVPLHVFRSQAMFSRLNLIVCLNNHCIHNPSCENRNPCVFPGQIWHQSTFPGGRLCRHSDILIFL